MWHVLPGDATRAVRPQDLLHVVNPPGMSGWLAENAALARALSILQERAEFTSVRAGAPQG